VAEPVDPDRQRHRSDLTFKQRRGYDNIMRELDQFARTRDGLQVIGRAAFDWVMSRLRSGPTRPK